MPKQPFSSSEEEAPFIFTPISMGPLEVFLAQTPEDLRESQALRRRVFLQEFQMADPEKAEGSDLFDSVCDHLLVRDKKTGGIIGTYRLARRKTAEAFGSFYMASEFDISVLLNQPGEILELSRACVDIPYRALPTMHLLWRGLAEYALGHNISLFFGGACFLGTDPQQYAHAFSYLYYTHLAPLSCRPRAQDSYYVDMRLFKPEEVDVRKAIRQIPTLVKGYLRVGGFVGDGIFVDKLFNSMDVCIVVKTDLLTRRYANYYNIRSAQKTGSFKVKSSSNFFFLKSLGW